MHAIAQAFAAYRHLQPEAGVRQPADIAGGAAGAVAALEAGVAVARQVGAGQPLVAQREGVHDRLDEGHGRCGHPRTGSGGSGAVRVPTTAVQSFEGKSVVFVRTPTGFKSALDAMRDGGWTAL